MGRTGSKLAASNSLRPRWPSAVKRGRGGLVVRSRPRDRKVAGPKPDSTEDPPCMGPAARQTIRSGQTPSRRSGAKIPTLARPTQKGCKAGRGPVGRPPPACGGRDLLGTIKKMIQALPEEAWRGGRQLRCRPRHPTAVQNYEVRP
ncbi:hypothetical protein AVEN_156989-1 [Araneus ventricosus]|uniref:Uncharacterized protein n=1 Tax=Araneus ventricosus TaxID=182803 RepID=A0A4Y2TMG3_ARAVE|nr:hypothetical protein AVEN_156989-1 [Araneus ventricosus]